MNPVLEVVGLSQRFGGLLAISDLSVSVRQGEIVAVIGPNGAGKTTFFNCVTGIYKPTAGQIFLWRDGQKMEINGKKPHEITAMGMARTFQNIRLFGQMTALENVMLGRHCRSRAGIVQAILRDPATRREERETVDKSYALLEAVGLAELWREKSSELAYGAQRRLELARALATEPDLLLLDEPAAGMNPKETQELEELIRRIRADRGVAILLIEHDMSMVMSISDRVYVMEYGACIASGTPAEVRANPQVVKAYLGEANA